MSVVALVIAPSIAIDQNKVASYLKSKNDSKISQVVINQIKQDLERITEE